MQQTLRVFACVASVVATAALDSQGGSFEALWSRAHGASHSRALALKADPKESPSAGPGEPEAAHFGDTRCPCIGFDNIEGETTVVFEDDAGKELAAVAYPADLGARCEAWDKGRHYQCEKVGKDNAWCEQQWCYVDPCNCKIPVLPKMSMYSPDARYRGKPLFFSYATCGGKDMWTKALPEVGTPGCRCVNFDNVPGSIQMNIDGKMVAYPAEIGGTCSAWDKEVHPLCKAEKPPKWCAERWCYVDPCSCSLSKDENGQDKAKDKAMTYEETPKISSYLPDATFTGKSIYYSYETCNGKDHYTRLFNKGACVNQESKRACNALSRCAWTGKKCLGAELINHPLCKGVVSDVEEEEDAKEDARSGVSLSANPMVGFVAAILFICLGLECLFVHRWNAS